jgi:hypothetical protein
VPAQPFRALPTTGPQVVNSVRSIGNDPSAGSPTERMHPEAPARLLVSPHTALGLWHFLLNRPPCMPCFHKGTDCLLSLSTACTQTPFLTVCEPSPALGAWLRIAHYSGSSFWEKEEPSLGLLPSRGALPLVRTQCFHCAAVPRALGCSRNLKRLPPTPCQATCI